MRDSSDDDSRDEDLTAEFFLEANEDRARRKEVRRAILGGVAGLAMLLGPIILAKAVVPDDNDVETDQSETSLVAALRNRNTAHQADLARVSGALSLRTTTTVPPPPPETTTTEAPTTTTEPPPPAEQPPPSSGGGVGDPYDYATWDALAGCESGGNWAINTGNGYYGGLQFALGTWRGLGGEGLPSDHTREEQIAMGIKLYERSENFGAWPACRRKLGLP